MPSKAIDISEKLPVGNYVVKSESTGDLFLDQIDEFTLPPKLYGNTIKHTERIISTYEARSNSTGVMLNGEKGSGKTLLAKNLSIAGAALGIPTIIINTPFSGDEFNSFIQNIDQEAIILFDEFEKIYDEEKQEQVLTLLDGVYPSKKLFILTCNSKYRVDAHMKNRPGRIYYMLDFYGLDAAFIREYCEDALKEEYKGHIDTILNITSIFTAFNFDMLKALCEEMNRYGESPQEALKMLNVKPEFDSGGKFTTRLMVNGVNIQDYACSKGYSGNPLRPEGFEVEYLQGKDSDGDDNWEDIQFTQRDLVKIDVEAGTFLFKTAEGEFELTRDKPKYEVSYYGAF